MNTKAPKDAHHDAIVIGGGIGGLAFSAVAGAVLGKKILMLEKNAAVGGRLYSFHKDGFTLDIGVEYPTKALGMVMCADLSYMYLNFSNVAWYNGDNQEIVATYNGDNSGRVDLAFSGIRGKVQIKRFFSW